MPALLLSAAATCLGSLAIGQGLLALCGAKRWNWIAAPVGLAAMILIAVPAIHVPGRASSTAILMLLLALAGIGLWLRRPAHRPPLTDILAALPVAIMVLVPFVASDRAGTLGVSFDNDMGAHLLLAEAYRSAAVAAISPLLPSYPLGPHALAATLAEGLGARVDLAFAGLTVATPVLMAWTAIACVPRARWLGKVLVASVVGIPYLVAAYYGEGAFKEVMEATFVLATALILAGFGPRLGRWRAVPLAFVLAGAVSVYSLQGLAWPAFLIAAWVAGRTARTWWRSGWRAAWREQRAELLPAAIGAGVLVFLLIPQIPRVVKFASNGIGGPVAKSELGNLVGPLPVWESFGTWNNPDFRFPNLNGFTGGMWTAFVLALAIAGGLVMMRRGRWMLPFATVAAIIVWAYVTHGQSPYVAAKALVIAAPLILLLASVGLVENLLPRSAWSRVLVPLIALALFVRVVDSSLQALRFSKVGATAHLVELRSLQRTIGGEPVLFMGNDDFYAWELAGSHVTAAYYAGIPGVPARPEKPFTFGQPVDFDSLTAATINSFDWFITTRDAAASQPPAQLHLVRVTPSYELWQRTGTVEPRRSLAEGASGAAVLDCTTPAGRAIVRTGGVAAVRSPSLEVPVPLIGPGSSAAVTLTLPAGTWDLETPYTSPLPITVTAPGFHVTLPANLDRAGPRWPIGRVTVTHGGPVTLTMKVPAYALTPDTDIAAPVSIIATREGAERIVPVRRACGLLVDWYRPA